LTRLDPGQVYIWKGAFGNANVAQLAIKIGVQCDQNKPRK
jgi:hypothetical protein